MTLTAGETVMPTFDVKTLPTVADPYPLYADWRRSGPLIDSGIIQWGVTRHANVSALLKDRRLGHRIPIEYLKVAFGDGPTCDFQSNSILNRDAPDHTRLRRLMSRAFSRPLVEQLRGHIAGMVDALLQPLLDGARFDVVDDLAFALPSQVICELLGIPADDRDLVRTWAVELTGTDRERGDAAVTAIRAYIGGVLEGRRPDADGDLLERMLAAEEGEDALTHAEIVDNAALLFFAGFETTKNLIANGTAALLQFPEQCDRLWREPMLSQRAVEEFLRYDGPVPSVTAITADAVEVGGVEVPSGNVLYLLLGCANRDEDVFTHPEQLDITRDPNPHVAFGGGIHLCLGAMLARVEADIVFRRLAERTRAIEAVGDPVIRTTTLGRYRHIGIRAAAR
jgi:cytochrome P450